MDRPETGAMRFGDDWTGVFLRGDDALSYALALKNILERTSRVLTATEPTEIDTDVLDRMNLSGLVDLLLSCEHPPRTLGSGEISPLHLKTIGECLK